MMNYYNSKEVGRNFNSNYEANYQDDSRSSSVPLFGKLQCMALILFMMLSLGQLSWAQSTANYTFSTNATSSLALDLNGNAIDMLTGTTQLLASGVDDTVSPLTNLNLGAGSAFDFFFQGNRYFQFGVSDNGLLTLGATPVTNTYAIGTGTTPTIAPFANDMRVGSNGRVEAKILGTAPNRTLVVQWTNNMIRYAASAANGTGTFQVRLYESSGIIEYVYGEMATNASTPTAYNVGFSINTTANNILSVNTTANTVSTAATVTTNTYLASATVTQLHSTANGSRRAYVFIPPGNAGNAITTTLAPPTSLTFTGVTAGTTTLNWVASAPTTNVLRYAIFNSTNGGTSYNFVNSTALGTNTFTATGLIPDTNYTWKVYAVSEGGKSTDLVGSQLTLPAGNISAIATGLWSATTTWSSGTVPTSTDNVIIPTGFTVTEDVTAASAYSLVVQGDLVYTATTARTLTVVTNTTIDAGGSIKSAATGTVTTHSLVVGGNLINNGTIDFSTNANTAAATITFNTPGNANFTLGAGSVTNLKNAAGVTLNKGTNITNVLTFNPGGTLTVQGANALGFMVITNGLLKLDGTNTFNNPLFATAGYTIAANGGFWQNNPNATIVGLNGSPTVNGLLRISTGTLNIGTAAGNSMGFSANSTINIEGGTINASSRFGVGGAGNLINYTQTGGTINVNQIGNTSTTLASFDLGTNINSVINFTAGTVNVVLAGSGASGPRDVRGTAVFTPNYAGTGMINFGTAASGATPLTYFVSGAVPALTISTTSAVHNLSVAANNTQSFGNVTIPTGSTFNLNGFRFILRGTNVINNGTLTGTTAGSDLYFLAGTNPQSYTGTGTVTAGLAALSCDTATSTLTIDPATSGINPLRVNLFSGTIVNSNKITIGTGLALATAVQIGATGSTVPGGNFDVSPTWNLGTGTTALIYAPESIARTSGFEVNPTRIVTSLSVDNSNGLTIAGGNLTATTTLTLSNGIVTTGSNTLTLGNSTTVGTLTGGSATAYVNGKLSRSIASANTNTTFVTYPIGKSGIYTPIALAPATTSISLFSAESFGSNTGIADPSIIGLSTTRRFEALPVSGTFTDINVRLSDAGIVSTNIPVQAPTATGSYSSAFGSTATFAAGPPITITSTTPVSSANYTGYLSYANSNLCSGTPNPGATTATNNNLCLSASTTLGITTIPTGSGVTYQWQSSSDNVTYTNILNANNTTLLVTPTTPTWYQCVVTCSAGPVSGTSTPIQIVFSNSVVSTTPGTVCGQGAATLSATASAGATINWYDAPTSGNLLASGNTFITPVITTTTPYYAGAVSSNPGTVTLGSGNLTSTTAPYCPLNGTYGGMKSQYLFRASELIAIGLTPGNISSLSFDVTSAGSTLNGYTIQMGTTALTALTSNIQSTPTTVLNAINYVPTVGINTFVFDNPFLWDGTSNIIVSISWSNNNTSNTASSVKYSLTGFTSSLSYRKDSETAANLLAFTGSTGSGTFTFDTNNNRPILSFSGLVGCSSARTLVNATVTPPPVLTLSSNTISICAGQTSSPVTITAGASSYDNYSFSPSTGVSGNAASGFTFNPSSTTTYTLTASQSSGQLCSTTQTISVTVNQVPSAITVIPATTCINTVQTLTATGGTITNSGSSTVGTATTATIQNGLDPTAFNNRYEHYWAQMVFTQAELNAAGVQAGNINSIKFNITTIGSAPNVTDFRVSMGSTNLSTLTGFVTTGINEVFSAATYTQTLGVNTITFTTPYVWDGTSNVIVDLRNTGIDSANNASTLFTATTDNKTISAITSTTFPSSNAFVASNPTGTLSLKRLNTTFDWSNSSPTTITWSPTTNLFTDAAATIPYTGTNASTVYFSNSTDGVSNYTVTSTSTAGCTANTTAVVTVNPNATIALNSANATQTVCFNTPITSIVYNTTNATGATVTGLPAGITGTYNAGVYTISGAATVGGVFNYTVTPTGCGTASATGTITVNLTPAPTASAQTLCSPATVANLTATGTNLQWYANETGGTPLLATDAIATNTYYVSQTLNTCESTRTAVNVTVNLTAPPTASNQSLCAPATVANLVANGTNLQWYTSMTGGSPLAPTTTLSSGNYYVSQTLLTCESTRTLVVVTINDCTIQYVNLQFPGSATIGTCGNAIFYAQVYKAGVTEAAGQGAGITAWIGRNTSNTDPATWPESSWQLATFNVQVGNNDEYLYTFSNLPAGTYYVASRFTFNNAPFVYGGYPPSGGGFWNGTSSVSAVLTVNTTAAPTGSANQSFGVANLADATIEDLVVTGTLITWYPTLQDAQNGTNALAVGTQIFDGQTYYSTNTVNGCPSAPFAVTVSITLRNDDFDVSNLNYYPNPVLDILNISYSNVINKIEVINLIGQVVKIATPNVLSTELDMSILPTATYLVKVTSEGKTALIKVVKK